MYLLKNNRQTTNDHYLGCINAPVELVQYGDFLCENCADVYPTIKLLLNKMGPSLKFAFRHYPVHTLHPLSLDAAVAAEAAALQGGFWYMHDMIFENQKHLLRGSFSGFAERINLDLKTFEDSRGYKKLIHKVINDFETGVKQGVSGTPTFFINQRKYNGFADFENLYRTCTYAMTYQKVAI